MIRPIQLLIVAFASLAAVAGAHAGSPREVVTERITTVLDQLEANGDFEAAGESIERLFDQVAVHAPLNDPDIFRHVALARRMVQQLAEVKPGIRMDVLKLLRSNSRLAHAICFSCTANTRKPMMCTVCCTIFRKSAANGWSDTPRSPLQCAWFTIDRSHDALAFPPKN